MRSHAASMQFTDSAEEQQFQRWFARKRYSPDLAWCLFAAVLSIGVQYERYFDEHDVPMPLYLHWCGGMSNSSVTTTY